MSRSYREPWYTDGYKGSKTKQFNKRQANKVIRRSIDVPDGKAYRRYYDPWNLCDYKFLYDPRPRIYWKDGEPVLRYDERWWRVFRK